MVSPSRGGCRLLKKSSMLRHLPRAWRAEGEQRLNGDTHRLGRDEVLDLALAHNRLPVRLLLVEEAVACCVVGALRRHLSELRDERGIGTARRQVREPGGEEHLLLATRLLCPVPNCRVMGCVVRSALEHDTVEVAPVLPVPEAE